MFSYFINANEIDSSLLSYFFVVHLSFVTCFFFYLSVVSWLLESPKIMLCPLLMVTVKYIGAGTCFPVPCLYWHKRVSSTGHLGIVIRYGLGTWPMNSSQRYTFYPSLQGGFDSFLSCLLEESFCLRKYH